MIRATFEALRVASSPKIIAMRRGLKINDITKRRIKNLNEKLAGEIGDDEDWGGLNSSSGAMALNMIESYETGGAATISDITIMAIGGGMSFDMGSGKNNATVSLLIGMADQTEGDDSYGTEVDVNFDHTLNSNVAWGAHVAYLSSSDEYGADGEDSEYQIVFPVTFSF